VSTGELISCARIASRREQSPSLLSSSAVVLTTIIVACAAGADEKVKMREKMGSAG
jgi:hypothetical protein